MTGVSKLLLALNNVASKSSAGVSFSPPLRARVIGVRSALTTTMSSGDFEESCGGRVWVSVIGKGGLVRHRDDAWVLIMLTRTWTSPLGSQTVVAYEATTVRGFR